MNNSFTPDGLEVRVNRLFENNLKSHFSRTDRLFAGLLLVEWAVAIGIALIYTPLTWIGAGSDINTHVYWSILIGGGLALFPAFLAWKVPGHILTRHAIAVGQMMMCALFIHLTGGRTTTHFFIFGSLAFLIIYRDWGIVVTATVVTAGDHLLRGLFFPQSVFGLSSASLWLVIEHAAYVVFEDIILVIGIIQARREMIASATRQVEAELAGETARREREVAESLAAESERQRSYLAEKTGSLLVEMNKFAVGDLRISVSSGGSDEIGRLESGFGLAADRLNQLLSQIRVAVSSTVETVDKLDSKSDELADLTRRQQADAVVVSEHLSNLMRDSEESESAIRESVNATRIGGEAARRGLSIVTQSVSKMEQIAAVVEGSSATITQLGASSDKIGRIVSTINDIARQTNLLALNAAVEAARAGEKGAGFAVVAGEVRQLSLRTGEAVAEINAVIDKIQSEIRQAVETMELGTTVVGEGIGLSESTRTALDEIVASAKDLEARIELVADVSLRQTETNRGVVDKVEIISKSALSSANEIKSIVDALRGLSELTRDLDQRVGRFKLNDDCRDQMFNMKNALRLDGLATL